MTTISKIKTLEKKFSKFVSHIRSGECIVRNITMDDRVLNNKGVKMSKVKSDKIFDEDSEGEIEVVYIVNFSK